MTSNGFVYLDPDGTDSGIRSLRLRAGADGGSKVVFKAKGPNVSPPYHLEFIPVPITVQLQSTTGACWQAVHTAAGSVRS